MLFISVSFFPKMLSALRLFAGNLEDSCHFNQFRKNILPLAGKGAAPSRFQNTNLLKRLVMAASKSTDWYTYKNFQFAFLPRNRKHLQLINTVDGSVVGGKAERETRERYVTGLID